jgi:hypothetical protein
MSLAPHIVTLQVLVGNQPKEFYALDIFHTMRIKLRLCTTRSQPRDLQDIKYLLDNYASDVEAIRSQLDVDDVEYFLAREYITNLGDWWVARYRSLLCG